MRFEVRGDRGPGVWRQRRTGGSVDERCNEVAKGTLEVP